jgi:hypothetical protein
LPLTTKEREDDASCIINFVFEMPGMPSNLISTWDQNLSSTSRNVGLAWPICWGREAVSHSIGKKNKAIRESLWRRAG